ncbi:MAG: Gldg family protein, partial [Myxococcota bacterium]
SDRVTVSLVAPESRPDLVERFAITQNGPRIVVSAGDRDAKARNAGEQEVTNALVKAAERIEKTVAFLQGHGELDFEDQSNAEGAAVIRSMVDAEGFETRVLSLLAASAVQPGAVLNEDAPPPPVRVPRDIKVLVIAGPQAVLPGPELLALEEFLARGGRILALVEPNTETGLGGFMRPWKIKLGNDFVVDTNPMNRLMGLGAASPQVFATAEKHPITDSMVSASILVTARSVSPAQGGEPGVDAIALLRAGDSAWGEVDYEVGAAGFGPEDTQPPVHVAVLATRSTTTVGSTLAPEGRLLVVGDSDFINNRNHSLQSNADLFLNMVNFLAEEEDRIAIRPRARDASGILLTGQQMAGLRIVTMDLIPALLIALGFGIVTVRRRR